MVVRIPAVSLGGFVAGMAWATTGPGYRLRRRGPSLMGQSGATKSMILDIDNEHFERHTRAIKDGSRRALDNLYLSPRVKGALQDLGADLDAIIAERKTGL